MEELYSRFNSYDFEADERFQNGSVSVGRRGGAPGVQIKLFYYNRFVEPIDPAGYRRWRAGEAGRVGDQDHRNQRLSNPEAGGEDPGGEDPGGEDPGGKGEDPGGEDPGGKGEDPGGEDPRGKGEDPGGDGEDPRGEGEGDDPGEPKVLSFMEVMRLIQAGEPVPGLVDGTRLDVTPSNQNPTPSQLERVRKPWEAH